MVSVKVEPEAPSMSNFQEKRAYYVVLGGDRPGVHMERPRNIAEGRHLELLPIVLTIMGFKEAQKVNELNSKVFTKLMDRTPEDPEELLALLKESIAVTKLFRDKMKKIYALKVAKLTGIWYGVNWNPDVVRLTKYKGAEFKGFKTFMQAMQWMLDKRHLRDQEGLSEGTDNFDEDEDEASYWANYPDDSTPPLPVATSSFHSPDLDPFKESASHSASPTKQHCRDASPSKLGHRSAMTTWTLPPPSSPTKEKHALPRATSPMKGMIGAPSIERSASGPPPYASARIPASSSVRFAPSPVTPSSNHGTPRAVRQSTTAQLGSSFRRDEVIDVSDDELSQEPRLPPVPSAAELRRIFVPPVFAHDGTIFADSNAITLGGRADAWLNGRRTPPNHRILILQAYISCDTTDKFALAVSRSPLNITVAEAEALWTHIARVIPPV